MNDPYFKLKPWPPTSEDELCSYDGEPPIKLMSALGENPLHCMNCNREVRPEDLAIPSETVEAIAAWRSIYDALDRLWLSSGEYEGWAAEQLSNMQGQVNVDGRSVQQQLDNLRRCYYRYFQDQSAEDYEPLARCPNCGELLADYTEGSFLQRVCEACSIVVVAE